ncbi:U11/U12 small nuclear ribonucleoprotein 48 kDa protein [Euphorbia lathyris]|uniref:U11/U12 small nuclear ribonucleoprotein 48 kDa protein n=1 Tax=Euphorbia lathyris TaxID=212925 RepID=UPI003313AB75
MNPSSTSYPFPHPPQNPPFFFHSLPQPPPLPQIPPPTAPDLFTSLSSLTHLLSLSHKALSSLLPSANPQNANFVSCLNNPHHLFPPESLFLHSLRCPSPLFEDLTSLLDSLHYPRTLNPQNPSKNIVIQDSGGELCVSIDCYYNEFASNFFYQDCPGVVNFNRFDNANRSFVLPSVLSVECANGSGSSCEGDFKGFDETEFRILPSDLWAIRREVEGWVDFPFMNSYAVFCAILQLNMIKWSDLNMWVISSSPRYGVVIDVYMRDHISVLFSLCLKAIRKEALSFLTGGVDKKHLNFHCPIQGQVLQWVASQLSVLYGEMHAKCFVIHIFKQCILEVANRVLFPLGSNLKQTAKELDANGNKLRDVELNERFETSLHCKVGPEVDERFDGKVIFVSQVAASVAALHERSLLEAKIKRLREFQPVPRYQLMNEHNYVSKRADEMRNTRSDYRAIIDHDGLPRKPSTNQETGKLKTRQELLAEERDYKRRRMSYRGKKLKRTALQVMRDIIDEYTEEIKQAGGIGCFEKGAKEEEISSETPFFSDVTRDDELGNSSRKSSEATRARPNYQKQLQSDSTTSKNAATHDYDEQGWGHRRHQLEYQSSSRDRHVRDNYSGSPERHRSRGSSHDQKSHRGKHDAESTGARHHERKSSSKSNYQHDKSYYSVNSTGQKDENLDGRHRDLRNLHGKHNLKIQKNNAFEDRYDPAESHESYGNDVDTVNK